MKSSKQKPSEHESRTLMAEQLEPRILFSASPGAEPPQEAEVQEEVPAEPETPVAAEAPAAEAAAAPAPIAEENISDEALMDPETETLDAANQTVYVLNQEDVETIAAAAVDRWEATGLSQAQQDALASITYRIGDLGNASLAETDENTIWIDDDAAGLGWFLDTTPDFDEEYEISLENDGSAYLSDDDDEASRAYDLLTILLHEQGQLLGLANIEEPDAFFYDDFEKGSRVLPSENGNETLRSESSNPLSEVIHGDSGSSLDQSALNIIWEEGVRRWQESGISQAQLTALENASFEIHNLDAGVLGAALDNLVIFDDDGAGTGWYVDPDASEDSEFDDIDSAPNGTDLLSVVMHEQGHLIGLDDEAVDQSPNSVMSGMMGTGTRLLPELNQAAGGEPGDIAGVRFSITFNNPVTLIGDNVLADPSGDIIFNSSLNGDGTGPWSLTVSTPGGDRTIFAGVVGANNPLRSLSTDALGTTEIRAAINTVLDQTFRDRVIVGAPGGTAQIELNSVSGGLVFTASTVFEAQIGGTVAGTSHDQLVVKGTVTLDNATLDIETIGGFISNVSDMITLIDNDGTEAVSGTFNGLAEGDRVTVDGQGFMISYVGGTGNDVVLTAAPDTMVTLDGDNNLIITDVTGSDSADTLTIAVEETGYRISDPNKVIGTSVGTQENANEIFVAFADIGGSEIQVSTGDGADVLVLDLAGRSLRQTVIFTGGEGGTDNDEIRIVNGTFGTFTHNATSGEAGTLDFNSDGTAEVRYSELEPVDMSGSTATDFIFNLPSGTADSATLSESAGMLILDGATFESTTFAGPTGSITINGQAGDSLTVTTALDLSANDTDLIINVETIDLEGGSIDTDTADQVYNGKVTLGTDSTLNGGDLSFFGTVDGSSAGGESLTVNVTGKALFGGDVGAGIELNALTTGGTGEVEFSERALARESEFFLSFDTVNGSVVKDLSENDRDGSLFGNATGADGVVGEGLTSDGDGDYVRLDGTSGSDYAGVEGGGARTTAAWIRTGGNDDGIISWGINASAQKWSFRLQGDHLRVETANGGVESARPIGSPAVNDGEWHHVVAVFDPSSPGGATHDSVSFYVDGVLQNIGTNSQSPINSAGGTDVYVGTDRVTFGNSTRDLNGEIDEVGVWSRALTAAEIETLAMPSIQVRTTGGQTFANEVTFAAEMTFVSGGDITFQGDIAQGVDGSVVSGDVSFEAVNVTFDQAVDLGTGNQWTIDVTGADSEATGVISGDGSMEKRGTGTLRLDENNTFTGGFRLGEGNSSTGGYVVAEKDNAFGSGRLTSLGSRLLAGSSDIEIPNELHITNGGLRIGGANDITFTGAVLADGSSRTISIHNAGVDVSFTNTGSGFVMNTEVILDPKFADNTITISSVISGANDLLKNGNGTVYLAGDNTYTGSTTVTVGTLLVNGDHDVTTGTAGNYTVASSAFLGGTGATDAAVIVNAGGELMPGLDIGDITDDFGAGTLTLADSSVFAVELGGAGDGEFDQVDVASGGSLTIDGAVLDVSILGTPGFLEGDVFKIIDNDSGSVTTVTNPFTIGGAAAPDGTVFELSDDSGAGSITYVFTIFYNVNGDATDPEGTTGNDVVLVSAGAAETEISLDGSGNLVITDINAGISDDNITITEDGTGNYIITDPNLALTTSISGATRIDGNTISVSKALVLGGLIVNTEGDDSSDAATDVVTFGGSNPISFAGDIVINAETEETLLTQNVTSTTGAITFNGPVTVGATSTVTSTTGDVIFESTVDLGAASNTLTVDVAGTASEMKGILSGDGALTKDGDGTLTLDEANTYTGLTTVAGGVLKLGDAEALGADTGGTLVLSGAALDMAGIFSGWPVGQLTDEEITINGHGIASDPTNGALYNSGASQTNRGLRNVILGSDASIGNNGGRFDIRGTVTSDGGPFVLTKLGTNYVGVSGQPQLARLVIDGGQYGMSSENGFNGITGKAVEINADGTLAIYRQRTFDANIEMNGGLILHNQGNDSAARTLTINGTITLNGAGNRIETANGGTGTVTTNVNGDIDGTGDLEKIGAGTVVFKGSNTNTGSTTVSAGTLLVNGTHDAGAGNYSVGGGTLLGGVGTITTTGTVTVDGVLTTGLTDAVGVIGNLTVNADIAINSQFQFEIDGANSDTLSVTVPTEEVTLGGASTLVVTDANDPTAGSTVLVIDNEGSDAVNGVFTSDGTTPLAEGSTVTSADGNLYTISYVGIDGNDVVLFEGEAETNVDLSGGVLTISDILNENADEIIVTYDSGNNEYVIADPNLVLSTTNLTAGQFSRPDAHTVRVDASLVSSIVVTTELDTPGTVDTVTIGSLPATIAGPVTITAETINLNTSITSTGAGGDITLNGDTTLGTSVTLTAADVTLNGTVAMGANDLTISVTGNSGESTGGISGSGQVIKQGSGLFTLKGTGTTSNSYTGLTHVQAGNLYVGGNFVTDGAIQGDITVDSGANLLLLQSEVINNGSDLTIVTGGTVDWNNQVEAIGNLNGGGDILRNSNGTGITLDNLDGTHTFSGDISGSGANPGGVIIRGNIDASGVQEFSGGTYDLENLRIGNGTLTLKDNAIVTSTNIVIVGSNRTDIPGINAGDVTGTLNIESGTLDALAIIMGNRDNGIVTSFIYQSGGTVATTGNAGEGNGLRMAHWGNSFSTYNLSGGTLTIGGVYHLSTATTGTGTFTQTGGVVNVTGVDVNSRTDINGVGTFEIFGGEFNIGADGLASDSINNPGTVNLGGQGGILRATADWSSELDINLLGSGTDVITIDTNGFAIDLNGDLSGAGGLVKIGDGTLTIAGTNSTYAGATDVNAGTLNLNGNHAGGALYTVASGATLGGEGATESEVSVSGVLSPGIAGSGDLETGDITYTAGSSYVVDIDGVTPGDGAGNHDQVAVTGNVDFAGTPNVILVTGSASADQDTIDFLTSKFGANVTTGIYNSPTQADLDALGAADLVIVSRQTDSGDYSNGGGVFATNEAEIEFWEDLETPTILLSAFLGRTSRWDWVDSNSLVQSVAPTGNESALTFDGVADPLFEGIDDPADIFDESYDAIVTGSVGGGEILATGGAGGHIVAARWNAGDALGADGRVAGGDRIFLASRSGGNIDVLTEAGQEILERAIGEFLRPALEVTVTSGPVFGETYVIVDNDGSADAVNGMFAYQEESSTVTATGGELFTISYVGVDGNDVVLFAGEAETNVDLTGDVLTISDINYENGDQITVAYDSVNDEYVISDPNLVLSTTGLTTGQFYRPDSHTVRVDAALVNSILVNTELDTPGTDDTVTIASLPADIDGDITINAENINVGTDVKADAITLSGDVVLTNDVTLETSDVNGVISITGTVDSDGTARDLTLNTGTGAVTVTGAVGSTSPLDVILVQDTGTVDFHSTVTATTLQQIDIDADTTVDGLVTLSGALDIRDGDTILNAGLTADEMFVGIVEAGDPVSSTASVTVTSGPVSVGDGDGNIEIAMRNGEVPSGQPATTATVDLSSATSVDFDVTNVLIGNITIGGAGENAANGHLILSDAGPNNVSATLFRAGDSPIKGNMGTSTIELGMTNNFNVDTLTLGGRKGSATMTIDSGGTLNLSGDANAEADVNLGVNVNNTGNVSVGTLDLTGGTFNATIGALEMGAHGAGGGSGVGALTFDAGTVEAETVTLGTGGENSEATINQRGGTFTVANGVAEDSDDASFLNIEAGDFTVTAGGLEVDRLTVGYTDLDDVGTGTNTGNLTVSDGDVRVGIGTASGLDLQIGYKTDSGSPAAVGSVDFTGASSVVIDVDDILVGVNLGGGGGTGTVGTLLLSNAGDNTITADVFSVGDSATPGNEGVTSLVTFGSNQNTANIDTFQVAGRKTNGTVDITAGGTLTLSGNINSETDLRVGTSNASTANTSVGTFDMSGGTFGATLDQVVLGLHNAGGGDGSGTLTFQLGTVTANTILLADPSANGTSANPSNTNGTLNFGGGTLDLQGGNIVEGGGTEVFNFTDGTLKDVNIIDFTTDDVTQSREFEQSGGTFQIGADATIDTTTIKADFTASGGSIEIELNGTAGAGIAGGHDQIIVNPDASDGALDLTGSSLTLLPNFAAASRDTFVVIDNDGSADGITGFFNGLPEGATVTAGGQEFIISYAGGDGNDVVLFAGPAETKVELTAGGELIITDITNDSTDSLSVTYDATANTYTIVEADGDLVLSTLGLTAAQVTRPNAQTVIIDGNLVAGGVTGLTIDTTGPDTSTAGVETGDSIVFTTTNGPLALTGDVNFTADDITIDTNTAIDLISGAGAVTFTANQDIELSDGTSITTATGGVMMTSTGGEVLMDDDSLINAGSGEITLTADGDITLGGLQTTDQANITTTNGNIIDGGDTFTDITAGGTTLTATNGSVGDGNAIDTSVSNLEGTSDGDFELTNNGALNIGNVDAGSNGLDIGGGLDLTANANITDSEASVVQGDLNVTTTGNDSDISLDQLTVDGLISVHTTGPDSDATLIDSDEFAFGDSTVGGNLTATATAQDVEIGTATVVSTDGNIELNAEDDIDMDTGGTLQALNGRIDINVDQVGTPDAGGGEVELEEGTLASRDGVFITGGSEGDTFNLAPSTTTTITVDGNAPGTVTDGDTIILTGAIDTVFTPTPGATPGAGTYTFGGGQQQIDFQDVEIDNIAPDIIVGIGDSDAETLTESSDPATALDPLETDGTLTVNDLGTNDAIVTTIVTTGPTNGITEAEFRAMFEIDPLSPAPVVVAPNTQGTIIWEFDSGTEPFGYLGAGDTLTITYTVLVEDINGLTDTQEVTITIVGANDLPVISNVPTHPLTYTEGDGEQIISHFLVITDSDDTTLTGATVTISDGYVRGEDVLRPGFTPSGVYTVWNSATGTLTFVGTATIEQYTAALREVAYENKSDDPASTFRDFTFQVSDDEGTSLPVTRQFFVIPVDEPIVPPVIEAPQVITDGGGDADTPSVDPAEAPIFGDGRFSQNDLEGIQNSFRDLADQNSRVFGGFRFDDIDSDGQSFSLLDDPFGEISDEFDSRERSFTLTPFFSGVGTPGSTVIIEVFDKFGFPVAETMTTTSLTGDWYVTFPGEDFSGSDYRVEITLISVDLVGNPLQTMINALLPGSTLVQPDIVQGLSAGEIFGATLDTQSSDSPEQAVSELIE